MSLVFDPGMFALGLSAGVLGLVGLLSVLIGYAYNERNLLFLAAYVAVTIAVLIAAERLQMGVDLVQRVLLVSGPMLIEALQMLLFRRRTADARGKTVSVVVVTAALGLIGFYVADATLPAVTAAVGNWALWFSLAWGVLVVATFVFRGNQALETAGPWKWWLMAGHAAGLGVALLFLTDLADAKRAYWPVVVMLLAQAPCVYVALVWRSRLLNEIRLRSTAAAVIDPLTGLATGAVLAERLMRIQARAQPLMQSSTSNTLYLIEVQNWHGLLASLGPESNEKLLLETALRVRRAIGDNDLAARIKEGRFAVVAQGLVNQAEITTLATRLVVSGLRIDSPLLSGVELKFRVIVASLKSNTPLTLTAAQVWLESLTARFRAWPSTHRSRSILVVEDAAVLAGRLTADSSY